MSFRSTPLISHRRKIDGHAVSLIVLLGLTLSISLALIAYSQLWRNNVAFIHDASIGFGGAAITVAIIFCAYWMHRRHVAEGIVSLRVTLQESEQSVSRFAKEAVETNQMMEQVSMHFDELFQRIPAPCFCYDSDGRFKEWNRSFENLTLLEPRKIINEPVSQFVFIDADAAKMDSMMSAVFHGETFEGVELQTLSAAGGCKTLLCNMFPLRGDGGAVTAAICAGIDISERIRLELHMLQHVEMLSVAQSKLEQKQTELVLVNTKLEMLAMSDSLTGVSNHRALQERLSAEFKRSMRYGSALSLLLVDVDRFKNFNDSYGHLAGDSVLREVASILSGSMRDSDFVARYGGEEFIVLLPHADYLGALEAAERLRVAIEQAPWELIRVTASIGVATLKSDKVHYSDLIAQADMALYYCKQHGRNQVMHIQDLPVNTSTANTTLSEMATKSGDQSSRIA
jgi:diguanylate cyclase (GGDEF)-like protein/PAS domain S-box-containing protein